jgi:Zn-dependent peptidase ImmA (M78 family)/DNA-binding XRE family transcriptional regulator
MARISMYDQVARDADPRILGLRIQEARKARGFTQADVAGELNLSRPTYIAIEKGERRPSNSELLRLSELLGRSVHDLQRMQEPVRDFVAHFRTAAQKVAFDDDELQEATRFLQKLCEDYLDLENMCHSPLPRNYPGTYRIGERPIREAAAEVAEAERRRLGLGEAPVNSLRNLLEMDVGLRVFCVKLPSRIAGLFLFSDQLGGCIALQQRHPGSRRLWSLAHEYAHFLVDRYEAEITVLRSGGRLPEKERFADAFASTFLMPEIGLRRRFYDLKQEGRPITPAILLTLADLYGVSIQAMVLRLEDLRLVQAGTWDQLQSRGFRVREAQALLGLSEMKEDSQLPQRYVGLAAQAYEEGLITEGELIDYLHEDRQTAREMVRQVISRSDVTSEGVPGEVLIDLSKPLVSEQSA